MVHIIHGMVCCEHFVGDKECRTVQEVENHCIIH
jgi:hypothetical protein